MQNTFLPGYAQQSRLLPYFKDILNNFFSDPANIRDQRITNQLYQNMQFKKDCLKIGQAFNDQRLFIGSTPCITVSIGNIQYNHNDINFPGNPNFLTNKTQAPIARAKHKTIPINITIVTQSYMSNLLLAQLLQLFFITNIDIIQADCVMIDNTSVIGLTAPQIVKPNQAANAKELYKSVIQLVARGHILWATDTQGPVFQGLSYTTNL